MDALEHNLRVLLAQWKLLALPVSRKLVEEGVRHKDGTSMLERCIEDIETLLPEKEVRS